MRDQSKFELPPAPAHLTGEVKAWCEAVVLPTYEPAPPDKNPMFLENRVYQGSSGRIYPLPFVERVAQEATPRAWRAAHIENEYLRLMILPEVGGRIHVGLDKSNSYDFFYRQNVVKPALVGLAGPWISGGVEFNWPQHHRPATYMPVEVTLQEHEDGSITVWCSDHDPLQRLKGAHGVCLHPGKAYLELKVRLYNRTAFTQTFLWWANVAVHVNEDYQSFFPPDVQFVADHAKRAVSKYPMSESVYYGVDYGNRAKHGVPADELPTSFRPRADYAANDLSWYANIPVPTSYMAIGSQGNFLGGYDHGRKAGFVHVANHHIAPGKKQWTWGNGEFGYAWDRNLTDSDGPYIELMAGAYTDNQPDFSFLAPGESKTFRQYWYPIQEIGVPQEANQRAAMHVSREGNAATVGLCVTEECRDAVLSVKQAGEASGAAREIAVRRLHLKPGAPVTLTIGMPATIQAETIRVELRDTEGAEIISYEPAESCTHAPQAISELATEPQAPEEIASADELFITGLHLWQYRHATRSPEDYWREGVKRDREDSRCNDALGMWHLRRGQFRLAEEHFRAALGRLTKRNPDPPDGEAYFHLGLTLRFLGRDKEAYDAFYKSAWNYGTRSCGYHALAELDVKAGRWTGALEHLQLALSTNMEATGMRNLSAVVLKKLGRDAEAAEVLKQTLVQDPTDYWAAYLSGSVAPKDNQMALDLAFDYAGAGLYAEACDILQQAKLEARDGAAPICCYALAFFHEAQGNRKDAAMWSSRARGVSPDYCFPNRLEELQILQWAIARDQQDGRSRYYLGNFLYDRRRYREAIEAWEAAAALTPDFATVWRNLGIAYFNVQGDAAKARDAFDRGFSLDRTDARLFYERDQLWKRIGVRGAERLDEFERRHDLVHRRDDLSVELAALYQQAGRYGESLGVLSSRRFQPWEGGEGLAISQHVRAQLATGRSALAKGDPATAKYHFEAALKSPENLGEAKHLLVNHAHVFYWLGIASDRLGNIEAAQQWWKRAARSNFDFQEMSVRRFSEMSYYRAAALEQLGEMAEAARLFKELLEYAAQVKEGDAKVDYFATSLPSMLLFKEDLRHKNKQLGDFLAAQAQAGLGHEAIAIRLLQSILETDPNHALASDFLVEIELTKAAQTARAELG